jgi:hypothetical protein
MLDAPRLDRTSTRVLALEWRIASGIAGDDEPQTRAVNADRPSPSCKIDPDDTLVRTRAVRVHCVVDKVRCYIAILCGLMHRAHFELQLTLLAGAVVARINHAIVEERPQLIPRVATGHLPHVVHVKSAIRAKSSVALTSPTTRVARLGTGGSDDDAALCESSDEQARSSALIIAASAALVKNCCARLGFQEREDNVARTLSSIANSNP